MSVQALFDLSGQVALVTGASRGLGLQMARALGEMGARLAICARRPEELAAAAAELEQHRHHLETLRAGPPLTSPRVARDYLVAQLRDRDHEVFCCLYLDNRHPLIAFEELFKGTIDGAITNSGLAPASTALSTAQWTNTRAGYLDKLANLPTDPADASDIAALFATLTSHGDSTWATATGFAVAGDSMALTTTERNNVAAVTLRRSMANVEAAAVGDTLTKSSLYGSIQQAQRSNTTDNVGSLTIYKTGGTELGRLTLATASSVDQITGVS